MDSSVFFAAGFLAGALRGFFSAASEPPAPSGGGLLRRRLLRRLLLGGRRSGGVRLLLVRLQGPLRPLGPRRLALGDLFLIALSEPLETALTAAPEIAIFFTHNSFSSTPIVE